MTEPMVPPDVDLRGLPWMRLDTSRLLDSDLFALSTGDEFKAAVALWCKAWSQAPAGSLPNDDRVLAHLSGTGARWRKLKAMALRGWVECSDGRLYHPVVAEQVRVAWAERIEYRERKAGQNARQEKQRAERATLMAALKEAGVSVAWNAPIADVRALYAELPNTVTPPDMDTSRTCHSDGHGLDGTGRDGKSFTPDTSARTGVSEGSADDLARALHAVGFPDCSGTLPDLVAAKREGVTGQELAAIALANPSKGLAYVIATARGKRQDAAWRAASGGSAPAHVVIDPQIRAEAEARHSCADAILQAENDLRLELISPARCSERIAEAQASFQRRFPGRPVPAAANREAVA